MNLLEGVDDLIEELDKFLITSEMSEDYIRAVKMIKLRYYLRLNIPGKINLYAKQINTSFFYQLNNTADINIYSILEYYTFIGHHNEALRLIDQYYSDYPEIVPGNLCNFLIKAFILNKLGQVNQAKNIIQKALIMADKNNFVRVFIDVGYEIQNLIMEEVQKISNSLSQYFVKNLLDLLKNNKPIRKQNNFLTTRETEILVLVNEGLTNKEIADKLFLSISSIKAMLQTIFKKLNCKNRTQAIKEAKALKII